MQHQQVSTGSTPGAKSVSRDEFIERFGTQLGLDSTTKLITDISELFGCDYHSKEIWVQALYAVPAGTSTVLPPVGRLMHLTREGIVLKHPATGERTVTWSALAIPPRMTADGDGFAVRFIPAPKRSIFDRILGFFS